LLHARGMFELITDQTTSSIEREAWFKS
jgi:hypothetical protein